MYAVIAWIIIRFGLHFVQASCQLWIKMHATQHVYWRDNDDGDDEKNKIDYLE